MNEVSKRHSELIFVLREAFLGNPEAIDQAGSALDALEEQYAALEREADNLTERLEKRIDEDSVYRVYDEQVEENQRLLEQLEAAHAEATAYHKQSSEQADEARKWRVRAEAAEDQFDAHREALAEAHDQLCGCDRPTNPSACIAPEETWGAFALLTESSPAKEPSESPLEAENRRLLNPEGGS